VFLQKCCFESAASFTSYQNVSQTFSVPRSSCLPMKCKSNVPKQKRSTALAQARQRVVEVHDLAPPGGSKAPAPPWMVIGFSLRLLTVN